MSSENQNPNIPRLRDPSRHRLKSASTNPLSVLSSSQYMNHNNMRDPRDLQTFPDSSSSPTVSSIKNQGDPLGLAKPSANWATRTRMRKGSAVELGRKFRERIDDEEGKIFMRGGWSFDVDRKVPNYAYSPLFTSGLINISRPKYDRAQTIEVSSIASLSPRRLTNSSPTSPRTGKSVEIPRATTRSNTVTHNDVIQGSRFERQVPMPSTPSHDNRRGQRIASSIFTPSREHVQRHPAPFAGTVTRTPIRSPHRKPPPASSPHEASGTGFGIDFYDQVDSPSSSSIAVSFARSANSPSSNKSIHIASPKPEGYQERKLELPYASPNLKTLKSVKNMPSLVSSKSDTGNGSTTSMGPPLPLPKKRSMESLSLLKKKVSAPVFDYKFSSELAQLPMKAPPRPPRPELKCTFSPSAPIQPSPVPARRFEGGSASLELSTESHRFDFRNYGGFRGGYGNTETEEEVLAELCPSMHPSTLMVGTGGRLSLDTYDRDRASASLGRSGMGLPLPMPKSESTNIGSVGKKKSMSSFSFGRLMGRKQEGSKPEDDHDAVTVPATPARYRPGIERNRPCPTPAPSGPLPDVPKGRPSFHSEMAPRASFQSEYGVGPSLQLDATPLASKSYNNTFDSNIPVPAQTGSQFDPDTPPKALKKKGASLKPFRIKHWFSKSSLKEAAAAIDAQEALGDAQPQASERPSIDSRSKRSFQSTRSPLQELDNNSPSRQRNRGTLGNKNALSILNEDKVSNHVNDVGEAFRLPWDPAPVSLTSQPNSSSLQVAKINKKRERVPSGAFEYSAFESDSRCSSVVSDSDKENVEPNARVPNTNGNVYMKYHLPRASASVKPQAPPQQQIQSIDHKRATWGLTDALAGMGLHYHDQELPDLPMHSPALDSSIEWEYNDFCDP